MFSLVVRHDMSLMPHAPVVFLQYLAALAIVEGINSYDIGYRDFPIKLKWPNDICKEALFSTLVMIVVMWLTVKCYQMLVIRARVHLRNRTLRLEVFL